MARPDPAQFRIGFRNDFWIDFGPPKVAPRALKSALRPPKTAPRLPKIAQRPPQDRPRAPKDRSKIAQEAPRMSPSGSREGSRPPQEAPKTANKYGVLKPSQNAMFFFFQKMLRNTPKRLPRRSQMCFFYILGLKIARRSNSRPSGF